MKKNKIYSFDIFDTCIVRTCGKPENIFRLLAEEVVKNEDEALLRAFVIERKNAEKTTMLLLAKDAVTLDEIYDNFNLTIFTDIPKEQVKEKEIALELRSFAPIKSTIEKIKKLRNKGRILFISDMYLPDEVIQKTLTSFGIMQESDHLYISGSIGLSKHTGRLFEYVREKECIRKSCWTHYGDNIHSDYFMPKRKGIKVKLVHTGYSEYETIVEDEARFFVSSSAASVFAGLMRAERLGGRNDDGGFVADIMAPLLVPFVDALLKDATTKKVCRLYFASRDAYIMYLIAKEFSSLYPDMEIRYLHISTKAVYPSSIYRADKEEFSHILKYIKHFSPRIIMEMFDCTNEEIHAMEQWLDMDGELCYGNKQADLFLEKLLEGNNRIMLKNRCAVKRQLLIEYLKQEGFWGDSNALVGLVDIGWRCSTQAVLRKIVDSPVKYYYWGVVHKRIGIEHSGVFTAFHYSDDFKRVCYYNKFIEYYICRNIENTTLGYRHTAEGTSPVLAEQTQTSSALFDDIMLNHTEVLLFANQYKQYKCLREYSADIFHSLSLRVMYRFMLCPNKDIVFFLSSKLWIRHFWKKKIPAIIKLYPWTAFYIASLYCLKNISSRVYKYRMMWLEASLIYTYGALGKWLTHAIDHMRKSSRLRYEVRKLLHIMRKKYDSFD